MTKVTILQSADGKNRGIIINGVDGKELYDAIDGDGFEFIEAEYITGKVALLLTHGDISFGDLAVAGGYAVNELEDKSDVFEQWRIHKGYEKIILLCCHPRAGAGLSEVYVPFTEFFELDGNHGGLQHAWKTSDMLMITPFGAGATDLLASKGSTAGKTASKARQKARSKERKQTERAEGIIIPEHIELSSFQSDDWEQKMTSKDGESWKKAKGEVSKLWNEGQELRQNLFADVTPQDFINKVLSMNTDPSMQPIEEKFAQKFGSYKSLPYGEWFQKVNDLWMDVPWSPCEETLGWAKSEVVDMIQQSLAETTGATKIKPLRVEDALPKVTTGRNSGWPFFSNKWHTNEEMLGYYMSNARKLLFGVNTLKDCPHYLLKRTQPNGEKPKMRPVECPPKHEAIAAKCLTDKFIEAFKEVPEFYGFNGGERVHEVLEPYMKYDVLVESDFSAFDQRVVHLMPHVFEVIKELTPEAFWPYLDIVLDYYQHAELVTPVGIMRGKDGRKNGLMSGEGWTSVIGTLANAIAVKYTMRRMGNEDYLSLAFGDDIAIATSSFNVDKFQEFMLELGMDCNKSKQNMSTGEKAYFSFLGWYHFREDFLKGSKGKFPMCRIAPGLYYREFFTKLEDCLDGMTEEEAAKLGDCKQSIDLIATVSKLANCRNNVDFEGLVEYTRDNCPHKLNTDFIVGFDKVQNALRNGRKQRNLSLAHSPVVQILYRLEGRQVTKVEELASQQDLPLSPDLSSQELD